MALDYGETRLLHVEYNNLWSEGQANVCATRNHLLDLVLWCILKQEENHHPVQALLSQPAFSYERRAILKAL
jgi:hypothetical protein